MTSNAAKKDKQQPPRKRIGRLRTPSDVARYIACTIKSVEKGEGENRAYKLTMMASILLKALEVSTLEKRITELERKVHEKY